MRRLLSGLALVYGAIFHYAYLIYIHPTFEYAHYSYIERDVFQYLVTYFLIAAPVAMYRVSSAPATYGAALIYVLCYVPAQLVLLFTLDRAIGELILIQVALAVSMGVLLAASTLGYFCRSSLEPKEGRLSFMLGVLTVFSMSLLIINYHQYMRIVSFEDVYELRAESNQIAQSGFEGYLLSWLSYCFLPFYLARGILRGAIGDVGIGLLGCVLIYMATGAKAAILMPFVVYALHKMIGSERNFLLRLMLAVMIAVFVAVALLPDEGALMWGKSILLSRILGTGGWTISKYYEYFSTNGFTFYTHIGPINALTDAYPYGEYQLGQVIGLHYSGSAEANFNANFWASDGFAALGIWGVPVVTMCLAGVFYVINRVASGHSARFVVLWLSGFWLAMLNIPLTTALLSGGGGLTLLLLWWARGAKKSSQVS